MTAIALPLASNVMVESIKALYGATKNINDFINDHIEKMKESEKHTVSRTGRVLDAAKAGFGIGYITPVIVIAGGQLILGNTLMALTTVATAATLTNPLAMTCAAVGAIYYGWDALSDQEKNEILEKLSRGLEIGIELVKSVISFINKKIKDLLSKENREEIKNYIGSAAKLFGRTLYDVTKSLIDKFRELFDIFTTNSGKAVDKTAEFASDVNDEVKEQVGKAAKVIRETIEDIKPKRCKNEVMTKQDSLGGDSPTEDLANKEEISSNSSELQPPQHIWRPSLDDLFRSENVLSKEERNRLIIDAHNKHGYKLMEISRTLGLHHSTVGKVINRKN